MSENISPSIIVKRHPRLLEWLMSGERGLPPEAMVANLTRMGVGPRWDHPQDPADLQQCLQLLDAVPTLKPLLPRMADVSPEWGVLVGHWHKLAALLDRETQIGDGHAPATHARMRELFDSLEPLAPEANR